MRLSRTAAGWAAVALGVLGWLPVPVRGGDATRLPPYRVLAGLFHIKVAGEAFGIITRVTLVGVKPDARIGTYAPRNGDELIAINAERVPGVRADRFESLGGHPDAPTARNTLTFQRWNLFRSHTFVVTVAELSID